jgi:hypothetical protein
MPRIAKKSPELKLDASTGYCSQGVSIYSRNASAPGGGGGKLATTFRDHDPPLNRHGFELGKPHRTISQLIAKTKGQVKKLEAKLAGELNHVDRVRYESKLEIARPFLARLLAEQDDMIRKGAGDGI